MITQQFFHEIENRDRIIHILDEETEIDTQNEINPSSNSIDNIIS